MATEKENINYLLKLINQSKNEQKIPWLQYNIWKRIQHFLDTKKPTEIQATKEYIEKYIQTPPCQVLWQSDDQYIKKYDVWNDKSSKLETLLHLLR